LTAPRPARWPLEADAEALTDGPLNGFGRAKLPDARWLTAMNFLKN
jgi:hypothetical protein